MRNIKIALANSEESIEKSKKIRENQCKNATKNKIENLIRCNNNTISLI
jgi:hypothetical protein